MVDERELLEPEPEDVGRRPVPPRVPAPTLFVFPSHQDDRGDRHINCPQCGCDVLHGDCLC